MRTGMLWLTIIISLPVQAEIYRWTDAQGRVHFGEKPPAGQAAQMLEPKPLNTMPPPPVVPSFVDWREHEQQGRNERRQQRLQQEREQQQQQKQAERCDKARAMLAEAGRKTYRNTSLEALQKRNRRREELRRRVKDYC